MRSIALLTVLLLAGCATNQANSATDAADKGIIGGIVAFFFGDGQPVQQPPGFAAIHAGLLAIGFAMILVGIVITRMEQGKLGLTLIITGAASVMLAWMSSLFGEWMGIVAVVTLMCGFGYAVWWLAWKNKTQGGVLTDVVKNANGSLDVAKLAPRTAKAVAKIKQKVQPKKDDPPKEATDGGDRPTA